MLNQHAVDNPMIPVNQCFFPPHPDPVGMLSHSLGTMGRQVFGTRMVCRETFLQIQRRLLQHLIRKSPILGFLMYQNTHHLM